MSATTGDVQSGGPLQGVHVLDLSRIVAAPYATMALGDLGAEVIKVERKGGGDDSRSWGPPFVEGESAYYLAVNRNKRSIECDFTKPEDQDLVRRLATGWADVLVENFNPGSLERWNLDLAVLRSINTRLITATIRGYPPGDDRPGYDFTVQANSGLMSLIGPPSGTPYKVGIPISDLSAGLFLLSGVLAALYERAQSGKGQHLIVTLWESQVAMNVNVNQNFLATGKRPSRLGNAHPQVAPYETVHAADGEIALAIGNQRQFEILSAALGHSEWLQDERFVTNAARLANRQKLIDAIESTLSSMTRAEAIELLTAKGIPVAAIRWIDEVFESPEAALAETVTFLDHPTIGRLPMVRLPWRFSRTQAGPRIAPPLRGQHSEAIRKEAGM